MAYHPAEKRMAELLKIKINIQDMERLQGKNTEKIRKLALKLMDTPEQKQINELHRLNRQLGQDLAEKQKELMDGIRL